MNVTKALLRKKFECAEHNHQLITAGLCKHLNPECCSKFHSCDIKGIREAIIEIVKSKDMDVKK